MAKLRLLYAEDDEDTREMTILFLAEEDFKITAASSGFEAIKLAETQSFDAVLLDERLMDVSGIDVCRVVRMTHPELPIVFYSGSGYLSAELAMAAGASAYLSKPDKLGDLPKVLLKLAARESGC